MERARTLSTHRSGLRNAVFAGLLVFALATLAACGSSEGDAKSAGQEEPARAGPAEQLPAAPDTKGDGEEELAKAGLAEQLPESAAAKGDGEEESAKAGFAEQLPDTAGADPVIFDELWVELQCLYRQNFLDSYVGRVVPGGGFRYDSTYFGKSLATHCWVTGTGGHPAYALELFVDGMPTDSITEWDGGGKFDDREFFAIRPLPPGRHQLEATIFDATYDASTNTGKKTSSYAITWEWSDPNRVAVQIRDHDAAEAGGTPIALTAGWRAADLEYGQPLPELSADELAKLDASERANRDAVELANLALSAVVDRFEVRWDFGDGESVSDTVVVTPGEDNVATVYHSWAKEGTYAVSVTITDQYFGRTGTSRAEVEVMAAAEPTPTPVPAASEYKAVGVYVSEPWEIGNPSSKDYPRSGASGETGLGFIDVFWVRQGLDRPAYEWTFDFSFGSPYGTQPPGRTIKLVGRGIREGGGDAPEDLEVPEIFFITNLPSENVNVLDETGPMEVGYGVLQKTAKLEVEIHIPEGEVGDRFTMGWGVTGCAEPCEYYWTYEGQ